jgi:hypothetical protein
MAGVPLGEQAGPLPTHSSNLTLLGEQSMLSRETFDQDEAAQHSSVL